MKMNVIKNKSVISSDSKSISRALPENNYDARDTVKSNEYFYDIRENNEDEPMKNSLLWR